MADQKDMTKPYEKPTIVDYGPITAHTFTRAGGSGPKVGDFQVCKTDKFHEYSCSSFS
ncbi:MAG TPA: hypothetical protein VF025_14110 [Gaiellaceae bacterium]